MKKKLYFVSGASYWNRLLRKFQNLYGRIKSSVFHKKYTLQQQTTMLRKLNQIFARLQKMQYKVGIKIAGTALAFMLISATSFAQDFQFQGNVIAQDTQNIDVGNYLNHVFADIDKDGDLDLYIGNTNGKIQVFTNVGSGNFIPTENLQADGSDISIQNYSVLSFADLDKDGDLDLYIGDDAGTIKEYKNEGNGNFTATGNLQVGGTDIDVGTYASPSFADLDKDGNLDLYIGNSDGYIQVFTNDGNGNFTSAGNLQAGAADINVNLRSSPTFADIDKDGDLDLFVGNQYGIIEVFTNDGNGNFTSAGNLEADGGDIDVGYKASPSFADLNKDGNMDLYVSERTGHIKVFTNDGNGKFTSAGNLQSYGTYVDVGYRASPVFEDIDKDGDLDLYVGNDAGTIKEYKNDGGGNFTAAGNLQAGGTDIDVGTYASPSFVDLDKDGNLDLYVGNGDGFIQVFTNDGSGNFTSAPNLQVNGTNIDVGDYSSPAFADLNGDGNSDLFVGEKNGLIKVFTNDGSGNFTSAPNLQVNGTDIDVGDYSSPVFGDIDKNGDLDLYIGNKNGNIQVFTNDGSGNFTSAGNFQADSSDIDVGSYASPVFEDINNDGGLDLFVGNSDGKIVYYKYIDYTNPTITCVGNKTENLTVGQTNYTVLGTELDPVSVDDNCGIASVINDFNNSESLDGAQLPVGVTTIDWTVTDKSGNTENCSFDVTVNGYVGLSDVLSAGISVYPNPSSDFITVSNEKLNIKKIEISDLTGKIVYHSSINSLQTKIDLSKQQSGVYFIKIQTDNQIFTKKIIKN